MQGSNELDTIPLLSGKQCQASLAQFEPCLIEEMEYSMRKPNRWYIAIALVVIVGIAAWQLIPLTIHPTHANSGKHAATTAIQHVVVIMMENHTFDNFFGQFLGANGVMLPRASDPVRSDFDHAGPVELAAIDGGKMDEIAAQGHVQYTQADIPNYWSYAQHYGLSDNFFTSAPTSSTPNHIAMIAAQTDGDFETNPNIPGCLSSQQALAYSKGYSGNQYWQHPCYTDPTVPDELSSA